MVGIKNAAPGGAGTPAEGLATTTDKESHMALADLTAPLDGCPECACRDNPPLSFEAPTPGSVMARYRCQGCGATWWTSWRVAGAA